MQVVDALVLSLNLDTKGFSDEQKKALDDLRKFQSESERSARGIESSARRSTLSLGNLQNQAVSLFATITGVTGLKDMIVGTIKAGSEVGRLSRAIGVSTVEITKWQALAREFGSSGEEMAGTFKQISDVFTAWKVGGPEAPQVFSLLSRITQEAQRLDAAHAKTFDPSKGQAQYFKDLADNLKIIHDLSADPNLASYLGGKIGVGGGMFDLLITGSDNVTKSLAKVVGMTQAEANAAGELDRQWTHLITTFERWAQTNILKTLGSDHQDLKSAAGFIDRIFGSNLSSSFSDASKVNNERTPAGAFTSQNQKEQFIRSEAIKRGMDPDVAMKVARSEGFDNSVGDNGTSFSSFQLHVTPGGRGGAVGDQFKKDTGLDPSDPKNEAAAIIYALDNAKKSGWHDYHGAARVGISNWQGINRGGSSSTTTVEISGPITVHGVKDPQDFTTKLRNLGLQRQHEASQSAVGGE